MVRCELTDDQLRFGAHEDLQGFTGEMAEELLDLRAMVKRFEEWAVQLETESPGSMASHGAFVTELRHQMRGA